MPPRFHRTPPETVAETVRETVVVGGRAFILERPAGCDRLLDHPWCQAACAEDGYVPYWPTLWPSARMLAEAVVAEPWASGARPLRVLEVGCGLGLAGCAALARGLEVTFSDVDLTALAFAERNARLNGFGHGFRTLPLDLRDPPADERFDVVLGADLLYEERLVDPLIALIDAVLEPGGLCLIADPDRHPAQAFRLRLPQAGYTATASPAGHDGGTNGTIYRIRRSGDRRGGGSGGAKRIAGRCLGGHGAATRLAANRAKAGRL